MKEKTLEKIWTKSFISISLTQFLLFTVFYALLTTLPVYVINDLGESQSKAGLIVTFMLISAILIRPFSPKILDITGKKKGLVLTVVLFTVTTFFYMWLDSFIPLLVLRFIHGISFGIVSTATGAIVADIIPQTRRGAGMGYFAMAMNLAIVVGPFIGLTLLQAATFQTLFLVLSILMVIGVVFSLNVKVPDMGPAERGINESRLKLSDLIEVNALPVAMIGGLVGIAYASILSFVPVYADEIGLSSTASYFFLVFAVVMIAFRPYIGRAFDEKGPKFVMVPSLLFFAAGLMVLGLTSTALVMLIAAGLIGLGYGSLLPGFQTMAIETTDRHRSGHAISTFFIFYDIGIGAGAFILGIISADYGFKAMYFACGALVIMTMLIFNTYLTRKEKLSQAKRVTTFQEVSDTKS